MAVLIEIDDTITIKVPFEKFINTMMAIVPIGDLTGLDKIVIQNEVPLNYTKQYTKLQAFYFQDRKFNKNHIKLFLDNIIDVSIPKYAFDINFEIGSLLLSEIIFHEIGHHVHFNKRHGVKKAKYEKFAKQYSKAGYCLYLKSRTSKILSSYKWASRNVFFFNKEERLIILEAQKELMAYLYSKNVIAFP